jgi:hypothetical protein
MQPLSFVVITGRVREFASPVGFVVMPLSHIDSFIWPGLCAESFSLIVDNFSVVGDPRSEFDDVDFAVALNNCVLGQFSDGFSRNLREIFVWCYSFGL